MVSTWWYWVSKSGTGKERTRPQASLESSYSGWLGALRRAGWCPPLYPQRRTSGEGKEHEDGDDHKDTKISKTPDVSTVRPFCLVPPLQLASKNPRSVQNSTKQSGTTSGQGNSQTNLWMEPLSRLIYNVISLTAISLKEGFPSKGKYSFLIALFQKQQKVQFWNPLCHIIYNT